MFIQDTEKLLAILKLNRAPEICFSTKKFYSIRRECMLNTTQSVFLSVFFEF
jgi:hypothetical protein